MPRIPNAPIGPDSATCGTNCAFRATAYDPDSDDVSLRFDWGNDSFSDWTDYVHSGAPVTQLHVWNVAGTYAVRAMARNRNEARSDWSPPHTVVLVSRSPYVDGRPFGPDSIRRESLGTVSAVAIDLDGDSVSLKFDWGDGVISEWTEFAPSGAPVSARHAWSEEGIYLVRARARDTKGSQSLWSAHDSVLVVPPLGSPEWSLPLVVWYAPAIGSDGTVYASGPGSIFAVRPDGSIWWQVPARCDGVALGPDDVLFACAEDSLIALHPDGTLKWQFPLRCWAKPALGSNGAIYVLGRAGVGACLMAIDTGGQMLWQTPFDGYGTAVSVALDGSLRVSLDEYGVAAFSSDGDSLWFYCLQALSPCAVDRDGTAYVGTHHNGALSALTCDGHLRWLFAPSEESFPGGVAIGPGGTLYGGEILCDRTDGECDIYFYAINPDGSAKWRFLIPDWDETTPAVCADGTVYFGTDVAFYALDSAGRAKWYWPGWSYTSPAVGPDGTVYVSCSQGLLAFPGTSPLANSPWPKYGCDARNSSCAVGH
jgi:hypothetical protein